MFSYIRGLEHKIRISEQKYQKEREEMEKRKKQDVIVFNKLSTERQHLESRWLIALSLHIIHDIIVPNLALEFYV